MEPRVRSKRLASNRKPLTSMKALIASLLRHTMGNADDRACNKRVTSLDPRRDAPISSKSARP
jgi:hypothetical protein